MRLPRKEFPFLFLLALLLVSPTLAAMSGLAPANPEQEETRVTAPWAIPEARASARARLKARQAELLHCQLETEGGKAVYEATLVEKHRQREILVDARSGTVLSDMFGPEP